MKRLIALFLLVASPAFADGISNPGVPVIGLPVIGGAASKVLGEDANQKLATYSLSGNTTTLGTVSGALTSGNCIKSDASGNLVDAATTCGGGGGSPGGSPTQLQYNSASAFGGISGVVTNGTSLQITANGALSSGTGPGLTASGTWINGGSATTTKPYILIEPAGTASTAWSTSGTGLGANAATGFTGNLLDFQLAGVSRFSVDSTGAATFLGGIQFGASSSGFALSDSNNSFRLGHDGTDNINGVFINSTNGSFGWSTSANPNNGVDTFMSRGGAAVVQLGQLAAASPISQTFGSQGSRAGTDTNIAGGNLTVRSGTGTGTGAISSLILQSPVAVGSGTGAQTQTTGLTIKGGTAVLVGYTVSTLPASPTQGAMAFVTDAVACTFLATVTGGGSAFCPVVWTGAAWQGA